LHFHYNQNNHDITYYNCSNYNTGLRNCDCTHYVRADFLEQVVLTDIRRVVKYAKLDEERFAKMLMSTVGVEAAVTKASLEAQLATLRKRDSELDTLAARIYEDNVTGKISDERMAKLMGGYETEQAGIIQRVYAIEDQLLAISEKGDDIERFVKIVRECTQVKRLTKALLHRFIDHIVIYHAERKNGMMHQRIDIHYNCVGTLEIPEGSTGVNGEDVGGKAAKVPSGKVTLNTRKGVVLTNA
jgi:hypothetical protein